MTFAIALGVTAFLATLDALISAQLKSLFGPDWLWWALCIPIYLWCDQFVERMTDCYKESISEAELNRHRSRKEKFIWLAQALSTILMVIVIVWLRDLATGSRL